MENKLEEKVNSFLLEVKEKVEVDKVDYIFGNSFGFDTPLDFSMRASGTFDYEDKDGNFEYKGRCVKTLG